MDLLTKKSLEEFLNEEALKRALGMTTINVGELKKILRLNFVKNIQKYPGRQLQV